FQDGLGDAAAPPRRGKADNRETGMIVYQLSCANDHGFDAWFRDSGTCDEQLEAGQVVCPACGSRNVQKAIMAPRLNRRREERGAERPPATAPAPAPT